MTRDDRIFSEFIFPQGPRESGLAQVSEEDAHVSQPIPNASQPRDMDRKGIKDVISSDQPSPGEI
jgi:hypothetical protein